MKCAKCGKKAGIRLKYMGDVCKACFVKIIESRVKKHLRKGNSIKKDDKIAIVKNSSKESVVGHYLFKKILKGLPLQIIKNPDKEKDAKIVVPTNLETEVEDFLAPMLDGKKTKSRKKTEKEKRGIKEQGRKEIKILAPLTESDIEIYAKIKNIKYKKSKSKKPKSRIRKSIDRLEEKYPGYKFSTYNSIKELKNLKD